MRTVRAAVCRAFRAPLTVEEIHLSDPGAGEVMVDLEATAICFSDVSFIDDAWGGDLPAVYGHESLGRITGLGSGVTDLAVGDRVLVTLINACGHCASCGSGHPVYCLSQPGNRGPMTLPDGTQVTLGMDVGGFAEATVVNAGQVIKIPETLPAEAASLLSCGVITGLGAAVHTADVRPGQTVVVIGAGGVGLNAIQGARLAGAARIVAVDLSEEKLDTALEFGATDGILAQNDAVRALRAIAPHGADAVIVSVGATKAYEECLDYLKPSGVAIAAGMPHGGETVPVDTGVMAYYGQGLKGSRMGDVVLRRDIPWLVDLYEQGRLKLDELVSGTWTLDQINDAIANTKAGAARRNVILFK